MGLLLTEWLIQIHPWRGQDVTRLISLRLRIGIVQTAPCLLNQRVNLHVCHIVRCPISRIDCNVSTTVWTAVQVHDGIGVRDETLPAEVVAAPVARHVVASALFLDVDAATGAGFCAHVLDLCYGLGIFELSGFAAACVGVPRAITGEAEFVVAVGTDNLLRGGSLGGAATVLYGEVFAALGGEAGDEAGVGSEEVLRESGVISDVVSFVNVEMSVVGCLTL
jgi:hypothetical protein